LRGVDYFYSNTVDSSDFYLSPIFDLLSYIKIAPTNLFWLTTNITNIYNNEDIWFQYSQNEIDWVTLDLNYINNNSTFRSLFDLVGKSGEYFYKVKVVRIDETYYSGVESFNLDLMVEKNVVGFDKYAPKSPINYTNSRLSVPKLGSVRMGWTRRTPASNSVNGSFILGQRVLGSFVTIDIFLNTTATFSRHYSVEVDAEQAFNLYRYYSVNIGVDINFDLKRANQIIRLISTIHLLYF